MLVPMHHQLRLHPREIGSQTHESDMGAVIAVMDPERRVIGNQYIHGDDHTDVTRIAVTIEREAFLDGWYKALALGSGPCRLCGRCALESGKRACRHPDKARPSMEACGIDVYRTARNNVYPIEVVRDDRSPQNYYGLVLLG